MRSLVGLYLVIGIVLLLFGMFATGDCPKKNTDVVSDAVFVLAWPVYLYAHVIKDGMSPEEWLHVQACEGGNYTGRPSVPAAPTPAPAPAPAR